MKLTLPKLNETWGFNNYQNWKIIDLTLNKIKIQWLGVGRESLHDLNKIYAWLFLNSRCNKFIKL